MVAVVAQEVQKMKKYTIEKLLDDALDTSSAEYHVIVEAFDGVKASAECEEVWCYVVSKYIADYNAAADEWGMIPADLSTKGRQAMLKKALVAFIRAYICTTKTGVEYYRLDDWPHNDDDLKDKPSKKGSYLNAYYDSVK